MKADLTQQIIDRQLDALHLLAVTVLRSLEGCLLRFLPGVPAAAAGVGVAVAEGVGVAVEAAGAGGAEEGTAVLEDAAAVGRKEGFSLALMHCSSDLSDRILRINSWREDENKILRNLAAP